VHQKSYIEYIDPNDLTEDDFFYNRIPKFEKSESLAFADDMKLGRLNEINK